MQKRSRVITGNIPSPIRFLLMVRRSLNTNSCYTKEKRLIQRVSRDRGARFCPAALPEVCAMPLIRELCDGLLIRRASRRPPCPEILCQASRSEIFPQPPRPSICSCLPVQNLCRSLPADLLCPELKLSPIPPFLQQKGRPTFYRPALLYILQRNFSDW